MKYFLGLLASALITGQAMAAEPAAAHHTPNPMYQMGLMVVVFIAIFYFLIWRPQSKKMKQQRDMLGVLQIGDEVIISGGILGKITKLREGFISLEICQGCEIMVQKGAISAVLPKGTIGSNVN